MRIGICEPSADYAAYLKVLLSQINSVKNADMKIYVNSKWLMSDILLRYEAFDILLVDREMEYHNGLLVAKETLRLNPSCQIVLLSEKNCILDEDYDIELLYFLPKEHVPLRLVTVIDRVVKAIQLRNEHYFHVQANYEKMLVPCSQVLYMEKIKRKTELVTAEERFGTYQVPKALVENAGAVGFVQCHRSFFVNIEYVYRIGTNEIVLVNGTHLPIGGKYAKNLLEQYANLCARYLGSERTRREP